MKRRKYNAYKKGDVEWINELPVHWEVKRNKDIFYESSKRSQSGKETLLTVSHITGVTPRSEKNVNMFMAETMRGYKICKQGDLLINTMWAWMGALGTSKYFGICSPAYNVYRPHESIPFNAKFFDYLYRISSFITEMTRFSKGIVSSRLRLYPKEFFQILSPLPPLSEQIAIANYLDQQTAQIDRKITLLQQKVEAYHELHQSLVDRAITRGLDPNTTMKESGINGLKEIPAHWEVRRVKDLGNLKSGENITSSSIDIKGMYPVYGGNGIRGYYHKYTHAGNFILIGRQGALCGNINYASGKFWATEHAVVVHAKRNINILWLGKLLKTMDLNQYSLSAAQPGLSVENIKRLKIPFPPLCEQNDIANYLKFKTASINKKIDLIQKKINLLQELRQALINEVVTGKIKVC